MPSRRAVLALVVCLGGICAGCAIFGETAAVWGICSAAVLICGYFFDRFEKRDTPSGDIALTAVMTALAVAGRLIFAPVPAFKPCAAVIILAGIYLGAEKGFAIGALTALISNFYFSQGIWTPFQMTVWGLTGLAAGLLGDKLKKSPAALAFFGGAAGLVYSVSLDVCSMLWLGGGFSAERFLGLTAASLWFTVSYMVSNVIFLLLFVRPSARVFGRLRDKYGPGR
ncbi:ECF transporter S component [Ruminococcus sp.]|uniref:ECF transporter S component n=1 Tax=Ruminococcus sp. TaxID=41978 RepID=UPI0025F059F1|nr:ECF transporter S component [Ruminococcus sp.]MBQ8965564.1 ECF transporter S component [Ruminococcus sp.]